jgi:WD40 repeat protein
MKTTDHKITSVNWMNTGTCLAVGFENGEIQLWDVNKSSRIRVLGGHQDRVGCMSWNDYILSTGSRDCKIISHDVRQQSHITKKYIGHKQEICGLKWSPDGTQLASGGNDNKICIWDVNKSHNSYSILHEFEDDVIISEEDQFRINHDHDETDTENILNFSGVSQRYSNFGGTDVQNLNNDNQFNQNNNLNINGIFNF